MSAQLESLRQQLCEAFIQRYDAEEKIKAIRNVLAGIPIGQAMAATPAPPPEPAEGEPT